MSICIDNAEREEYKQGIEALHSVGFKRISFVGLSAINSYAHDTSVFYRENNVFGI